eukprot:GFUD01030059.1.p1 GENE.GFUD01030059.1~~GFUD01030059.1.p1  ORF type:complete len:517 (+),score=176.52 GFUD01030059.1:90-1640(+)
MSSDDSDSSQLPTTQPLEGESLTSSQPDSPLAWSWLVHLRPGPASVRALVVPVCGDLVAVGRDPSCCQIGIGEDIFINSENENLQSVRVSRVQFEIVKEKTRATLVDKSMNGTYVNKLLVGKGKKYSLKHADVISILMDDFDIFLYLDERFMASNYPATISSKYLVGRELGKGSTAVVREGFTRDSSKKVAMKLIGKKKWPSKYSQPEDLMKEVSILQDLEHPCITKVLEVVEDENMLIIVMEYAAGGELFDQVVADHDAKKLSEDIAKHQFYQISHTIAYLHSKNVCHRDLKLENILLMEPGPSSLVKVTDFGLSKQFSSTNLLETYVGTPIYMAPEIISCCGLLSTTATYSSYSCKSDCWSLGVVLYMLLCGHQPFKETASQSVLSVITTGRFEPMDGACWEKVSPLARDLVIKLLDTDQENRLSAEQILGHQWFKGDMKVVSQSRKVMGMEDVKDNDVDTDSGLGSLQQGGSELGGQEVSKGDESKENEEMEVDGNRTIRRKARDRKRTQQEM